jgi:hypothetical protein
MRNKMLCCFICTLVICVPVISVAGTLPQTNNPSSDFSKGNQIMYPNSIRSDWIQVAKITASDAAPEREFGRSVAIDGQYAVVGEGNIGFNNTAYIFKWDGTTWVEQAKLKPSDSPGVQAFGYSVAISGDTVIIGAAYDNAGSAYIFTRSGTTWTQQAKLVPSDGVPGDEFGFSVAISGDSAIVGASYAGNDWSGFAYIFKRTGTSWAQEAKLLASDAAPEDQFGWSVSLSGDTAVVGSVYDEDRTGSAYVFTRAGSTWTQQQKLTASDAAIEDAFGVSVSIDGDTIAVGAGWKDTFVGAAYVYIRSGTIWTQQQKITASDGANGDEFGMAVSISGDTIVVGARFVNLWTGAAYIYSRTGITWIQEARINASDGANYDQFGWSVGISGNNVIAGAPGETSPYTGAAYLFQKLIPTAPVLNLTMSGGIGIRVTVKNTGDANATNVSGTLTLSGGVILFGKNVHLNIPPVSVNQSEVVKSTVFGFGKTAIKVSVTCGQGASATANATGFVFLFFVLGVK